MYFQKIYFLVPKRPFFADVGIFLQKNQHFLEKIVRLPKAIVLDVR